jgi:serine beta-lactamase-like protein LACTB, mitochondrial
MLAAAIAPLLAGLTAAAPLAAQSTPEAAARRLAGAAMEKDHLPSLSVAVGRDGKVVFAEAYGLADVENSVPATPRSVYRIGSVSKPLTATVALRLAERGELDLDAPIQADCPAFPDKGVPITARLLLAHQGGIRDYDYRRFAEEYLSNRRYESLADALSVFKDDPLVAPPGTEFHYSSFGYVLLGCALEGAGGAPYKELLRRHVLDPAGMAQTRLDEPREIVPQRAHGYGTADDGSWTNAVYVDLSDRFPAGGLLSTPSDLVAFGNALLAGRLVGSELLEAAWSHQSTADGTATAYGLGWHLSDDPDEIDHGGTSVGGSAYLYLRRDTRVVVAFTTNLELWTEPRQELARQLAKLFAP